MAIDTETWDEHGAVIGPLLDVPSELVELYMHGHLREQAINEVSDEQMLADLYSEWEYDQRCAAVEQALEAGDIEAIDAMHMYERVLRPLWIGRRLLHDL